MVTYRGTQLLGTNEIENLQRALINLGVATQRPAITARITGTIDDETMTAINAGLGLLTEELPSWLYLALQGVMVAGATSSTAKKYVGQYATQLALAANTAAVRYKVNPPVPTPPPATSSSGFFASGWYKTPLGLVLIAGAAFVGYRIFVAPSRKAA